MSSTGSAKLIVVGAALIIMVMLMPLMFSGEEEESQNATGGEATWSDVALKDIPPETRAAYERAAEAYKLDGPFTLAGVGKVETNHGRSELPGVTSGVNSYGCCAGPFQFMISRNAGCRTSCYADPSKGTWEAYAVDGNGDGKLDPYSIEDSSMTAAHYLSANGAPKDWKKALYVYNHSYAYGADVMEWGAKYRSVGAGGDLLMAEGLSRASVAAHPKLAFTNPCGRQEILTGYTDQRIVVLLGSILNAGHSLTITAMGCDHSPGTNHRPGGGAQGRAADIGVVDGKVCNPYGPTDACGKLAIQLGQIKGTYKVTELIAVFDPNLADGDSWADPAGHYHHIHMGIDG